MKPTKTDKIRKLLGEGYASNKIAATVGCTVQRVCNVRFLMARPGYSAEHMRRKRQRDRDYRDWEKAYQNRRYRRDPEYRERRLETTRKWRAKQREARA